MKKISQSKLSKMSLKNFEKALLGGEIINITYYGKTVSVCIPYNDYVRMEKWIGLKIAQEIKNGEFNKEDGK